MPGDDRSQRDQLGAFIKTQRHLAELSQRELARIAELSDAYVSQLERGMHEPTLKVLQAIAEALDVRAETMMRYAGWSSGPASEASEEEPDTESAIRADDRLSESQKQALLSVYRGFIESEDAT